MLSFTIESSQLLNHFWAWSIQCVLTLRALFLRWLDLYGELALRAFDNVDFDSFDFVRIETRH